MASTAASTTSGRITIPGPPPRGASSTERCLSRANSRMSRTSNAQSPRSSPLPVRLKPSGPGKASGKRVRTLAVQGPLDPRPPWPAATSAVTTAPSGSPASGRATFLWFGRLRVRALGRLLRADLRRRVCDQPAGGDLDLRHHLPGEGQVEGASLRGRHLQHVTRTEVLNRPHLAKQLALRGLHPQTDQIRVVELLGILRRRQGRARYVETQTAQGLGRITVRHPLDLGQQQPLHLALEPPPELPPAGFIRARAVGDHALRLFGKALAPHQPANPMGADDRGQANPGAAAHCGSSPEPQASAEASPSPPAASALSAAAASSASRRRSSASRRRSCAFALGWLFLVCSRRSRGGISSASLKKRATRSLGTAPWLSQCFTRSSLMTRRSACSRGSMGL